MTQLTGTGPRVAVVATGITGTTAPLALRRGTCVVDVIERDQRLDGRASFVELDGHELIPIAAPFLGTAKTP